MWLLTKVLEASVYIVNLFSVEENSEMLCFKIVSYAQVQNY